MFHSHVPPENIGALSISVSPRESTSKSVSLFFNLRDVTIFQEVYNTRCHLWGKKKDWTPVRVWRMRILISVRFAAIHQPECNFACIHPLVNEICTHPVRVSHGKGLSNLFHLFHIRGTSYLLSYPILSYIEIVHVKLIKFP